MSKPSHALWRSEQVTPIPVDRRHDRTTDPFQMLGFWMLDGARTKPAWPVAIWMNDGKDSAFWQIGMVLKNTTADAEDFAEFTQWSWLKCVAVSESDWHTAINDGYWPLGEGETARRPARHISDTEKLDIIPDTPASAGGNMGEDQFHAQVVSKIETELAKIPALQWPFKSLEEANKGAAIVEILRALGKQGEAKRKAEKQPFLDQAAGVDARWIRVRDASDAVQRLVSAIDTFQRAEKQRLQREADEREQAERERLAEEARKQAEQAGQLVDEAEVAAMVEERLAETPVVPVEAPRVGTAYGRAISRFRRKMGVITDRAAFVAALDGQDDFNAWLQDKADKLARAGTALNGMRIETE